MLAGTRPRLGFVDEPLNRAAEKRDDRAYLDALAQHPQTFAYVLCGDSVLLHGENAARSALFSMTQAQALGAIERIFLGLNGEAGRFGVNLDPGRLESLKQNGDLHLTDLRSLAAEAFLPPCDLTALAQAKALLNWHARHRFCAQCGAPTQSVYAGWRRDCPSCNAQHFPRTDPVVIMLVVRGERCLLGRQTQFTPSMWSCLAGFVEPGETFEAAVRREVQEESGIVCGDVRYFASQPWPFPASLMIGCHADALSETITVDRSELEDARWFDRSEILAMLDRTHPQGLTAARPMAIAHHIIRAWAERA